MIEIRANEQPLKALIDTRSTENFFNASIAKVNSRKTYPWLNKVAMASSSLSIQILGYRSVDLSVKATLYQEVRCLLMKDLCCDLILRTNFLRQHSLIEIPFRGSKPPFKVCSLATMRIPYPALFNNLTPDCKLNLDETLRRINYLSKTKLLVCWRKV